MWYVPLSLQSLPLPYKQVKLQLMSQTLANMVNNLLDSSTVVFWAMQSLCLGSACVGQS
jgi:hypothetical protein